MTAVLHNLYRLNPSFVFSEMHDMSSDVNVMSSSRSLSLEPLASAALYHSPIADAKTAPTFHSSHSFRKFSSEPSLTNTPCHSRCGFRERLQSDCLEEELPEFRCNISASHCDNARCEKLHDRCDHGHHMQHKLHSATLRRPLSDCDARLNSSSLVNVATTQHTLLSLSEEEIQSVCIDAFLER